MYSTKMLFEKCKVTCFLVCKRAYRKPASNFLDQLRVYVRGGGGGQGQPKFGGRGGDGGCVYVEAVPNMTLQNLKRSNIKKRFIAGNGENSTKRMLQGQPGTDLTVRVPRGVCVTTDSGEVIGDLDVDGEKVVVANGGRGGCMATKWNGKKGEVCSVKLVLKLIADVGLVGFPNAGKSTFLKAVSRTDPKIAEYPFTTLRPQLGVVHYEDLRQISVADLPGLIEGAHMNRGMGHEFLRHIERTKLLLFMVDVHGFQLKESWPFRTAYETAVLLNKELELYKPELTGKPAILALNKIDKEGAEDRLHETLQSFNTDNYPGIPDDLIPELPIKFRDIVPISAAQGTGIQRLNDRIREVLDEELERQRVEMSSNKGIMKS
ncbi:GTP-binding protein 10-like [Amphiura filiformis]|uniref:GTP-binding protein 10-like n=1 Tax=Amphiura filiformis TaxID=82378 RepID=UPI003B225FB6